MNTKQIMTRAWELAREGAVKFGGRVRQYLAAALRMAWGEQKMMNGKLPVGTVIRDAGKAKVVAIGHGVAVDDGCFGWDKLALGVLSAVDMLRIHGVTLPAQYAGAIPCTVGGKPAVAGLDAEQYAIAAAHDAACKAAIKADADAKAAAAAAKAAADAPRRRAAAAFAARHNEGGEGHNPHRA